MGLRKSLLFLLRGGLLLSCGATASAQLPGTVTDCEFGNIVDTYLICNNVDNNCYTTSVVVDTFSYCTTTVLPSGLGFQTGGGGGGGGISAVDQDGDDVTDCWNDLTFDTSAPVTSPFGPRTHPITGTQSNHNGIDIGVSTGTGVRAAQNGVVADSYGQYAVNTGSGNGNFVRINYADGTQGVYLHMETVNVTPGQVVTVGQLVGTSNNTGDSTGPHLHYSLWQSSNHGNGSASDLSNFHDPQQVHSNCGP